MAKKELTRAELQNLTEGINEFGKKMLDGFKAVDLELPDEELERLARKYIEGDICKEDKSKFPDDEIETMEKMGYKFEEMPTVGEREEKQKIKAAKAEKKKKVEKEKPKKAPKKKETKKEKSEVEKEEKKAVKTGEEKKLSKYGHILGTQAARIDDFLSEGKTKDEINKMLLEEFDMNKAKATSRLSTHLRHLVNKKGFSLSQTKKGSFEIKER